MPRNRIISQVAAVCVGPTPATGSQSGILQLFRIQSFNYGLNISHQDVNQFGNLGAIDRIILDAPTVNFDFSWLVSNALNESRLGFVVDGSSSFISGLINKTSDEKNYFLIEKPEGVDANDSSALHSTSIYEGFGNGFITSYTVEGAVGGLPTARVQGEALNYLAQVGTSGAPNPAVNPVDGSSITGFTVTIPALVSGLNNQLASLRPGDITVDVSSGGIGVVSSDLKIQRFSLNVRLSREPLRKLGSKFDFSKEIQFPVNAEMTVEALVGDYESGNLSNILCNDRNYDLSVTLRAPQCTGTGPVAMSYILKQAKLDSQNRSLAIGQNSTISLQFSVPISGPSDLTRGLFLSGVTS